MAPRSDYKQWTSRTTKSAAVLVLSLIIISVLLLWGGQVIPSPTLASLASGVGGLIFGTAIISVGWELAGKRAFADEVMAKATLSADISRAGLTRITNQYLDDVEWRGLIRGATKVDIVVAYASTWRNTHHDSLKELSARSDTRLRVYLPDPEDPPTMESLARRFNTTATHLEGKVREAISAFDALRTPGGGTVEVYTRPGDMLFSCYRFDRQAVLTVYSHQRSRTSVPTWVFGEGDLFTFVYDEINAIREQSSSAQELVDGEQDAGNKYD